MPLDAEVNAFKADLRALNPQDFLDKHIYGGSCAMLREPLHSRLKERVAGRFRITQNEVNIVGSAKLGFSIAPGKRYQPFGDSSDIDIAIVSSELYEKEWRELSNYERSGTIWEKKDECKHYCFHGWIRPDKLPHSQIYPFSKMWWDFFQALTSSREFGPYKIRAALYYNKHFFESYQRICIDQCRQELD